MNTSTRYNRGHNIFNTVMVLSDDNLVRTVIVQLLRECGYRIVQAVDTDEALTILQTSDIPIDVVLSGIDVPGSRNGFGLAQWARLARPEAKIMLAGTLERMARNAAELSEVGPLRKRTYEQALVWEQLKRL
jgi:CheY-like chemotaxis protein